VSSLETHLVGVGKRLVSNILRQPANSGRARPGVPIALQFKQHFAQFYGLENHVVVRARSASETPTNTESRMTGLFHG